MTTMDEGFAPEPIADFVVEPSGTGGDSPVDNDFIGDGATAGLDGVGKASDLGSDFGTVGDIGDGLDGANVDVSDIAQGLDDLASGNLAGAAGYGANVGLDIALAGAGLPGVDGVAQLADDFINDNWSNLEGDAEAVGIQTATSIGLGVAGGAVLGPIGAEVGSALGEFVGDAITPAVEDVASDTYNTGADLVGDTVSSFENAGDDLEQGDVLGAAGDVLLGGADDVGDLATGAYDLTGDGLEAVEDLGESTLGAVEDLPSDVEDVATSAADDVEDVADDIGDGVEDLADDLGDLF